MDVKHLLDIILYPFSVLTHKNTKRRHYGLMNGICLKSMTTVLIISAKTMFVEVRLFARLLPRIRSSVHTSEIRTLQNV